MDQDDLHRDQQRARLRGGSRSRPATRNEMSCQRQRHLILRTSLNEYRQRPTFPRGLVAPGSSLVTCHTRISVPPYIILFSSCWRKSILRKSSLAKSSSTFFQDCKPGFTTSKRLAGTTECPRS